MSWLFGGGGGNNNNDNDNDEYDDDDDELDRTRVIADFDATALVKGAAALKEIDASANAKDVLRLALEQEKSKQSQSKLRAQQLEQQNLQYRERMQQSQYENELRKEELMQKQWAERMERERQQKQQLDQQALEQKKKAQNEWLQRQRQMNEENMQRKKQIEIEIEKERRKSMEYQAKLNQDTARIQASAQADGKIRVERENEDIHSRLQKEKLTEERMTNKEIWDQTLLAYRDFASGVRDLVSDKQKMQLIGGTIVGVAGGIYALKKSIQISGNYIENRIGKPSLIRETSRLNWKDLSIFNLWNKMSSGGYLKKGLFSENSNEMKGIILENHIQNKMKFITRCTRTTKENHAPFRHLLIYGPPGTGKTLFAKMLARESGLNYAVMTGADFSQLGNNAVKELHKVFDWAETSRKGTILFIDEADAFLRKGREGDRMSEEMRNALSAFLYRTGTESTNFMIILASNVPQALDKAIIDRIDDMIEFPLPKIGQRKTMLEYYFNVYITQTELHANASTKAKKNQKYMKKIKVNGFEEDAFIWDRLAAKTDGFSGRQIAKYMIQVQAAMYGGMELELTPFLMEQVLETFLMTKAFGLEEDDKNVEFKTL